jgi:phage I-like protein
MDFKLLLCALLGLAEAATDTEIETAAKSFAKKNDETVKTLTSKFEDALKPLTAKIEALEKGATGKTGAEAGTITAPVTAALADSTEYKALTAKVAALEVADIMRERAAIEAQAVRDGKVIPLSALPDKDGKGGMDNKSLKSLVAELPVTVPMDKRTPEGLKSLAAGTGATTADDQVRQTMGISKEAWDKHNSPSR